ncbi:MAG: aspartate-semialdehyde dehydrogenase [Chitinophagales bacterium]|nr:aspartate-semialdehyde dehydrogenase [Chitinophagales bacterium]MDW8427897.1 aspartate-semialdehyde dehydrogenase [Chitinophagales bacterium]
MKVAVVGCTGLVGQTMLRILEERRTPVQQLLPVASARSVGKPITFQGKTYSVLTPEQALTQKPDVALFSAGAAVSRTYAPLFAETGTIVVDNSSCWRMHPDVPLVVPEVNSHVLHFEHRLIANPNCSTIQMVVALYPLHVHFGLRRIVVSTYQSVSGTGARGLAQLEAERQGLSTPATYPYTIDLNLIPHIDSFSEDGFTREEWKMVNEARKIMGLPKLSVTATCVRVPVRVGHSLSVHAVFEREFTLEQVRDVLRQAPGVVLWDDPHQNRYPMPRDVEGKDEVYVGRLRLDACEQKALNCWIVADNLRKGAATNAVQIVEHMLRLKAGSLVV